MMFKASSRERDAVRGFVRGGKARALRQILTIKEAEVMSALGGNQRFEFVRTVRFFLSGPGQKIKFSKGFVSAYMKAVIRAVEELRPDWSSLPATGLVEGGGGVGLVKLAPGVMKKWQPRRDAVSALAFESACGLWTASQWAQIEKAFASYESR